jgi:hypothetical protein
MRTSLDFPDPLFLHLKTQAAMQSISLRELVMALLAATTYAPRLWTDLYLGAVSEASGLRLVSFDADFARMGLSNCLVLANPN